MGRSRTARAAKAKANGGDAKTASKQATTQQPPTSAAPSPSAADSTTTPITLTSLLASPTAFLSPSPALRSSLLSHLQSLYGQQLSASSALRLLPPSALLSVLPSLLTSGFSVDQIFEQWQTLQRPLTQRVQRAVSDIVRQAEDLAAEQKERPAGDADGAAEGEEEDGLDEDDVDDEEEAEDEAEDGAEADEELDEVDADMEARLDAMQANEGEADEEEADDAEGEQNEDQKEGDDQEREEEKEMQRSKPASANKRAKRSTASATAPRPVGEDAFFSLDQMERFADHYEDIDDQPDDDNERKQQHAGTQDGEGGDEWDDEVDLDADVGDVNLGAGERYDDFFDPPTADELRGQSISDMHRQEDDEDEDGDGRAGAGAGDEGEEGAGEGDDGMEMDEDDEGVAAVEGDEFGGYFARVASHRRAQDKKAQQSLPQPATQPTNPSSTAPTAPLSQFAQQQQALSSTLHQLEQQLITAKPWYHRGEVSAIQRPTDSLLTTDLQVESNVKQREVMTRAVNESIEEIIRRRVSEGRYDDPVRRTVARAKPYKAKESSEVSSEKSTLGLGELYEQQYMEQKAREDAATNDAADGTARPHKSKQQQERDKQVSEIRTLFASLVADLSALSQYAYVPAERSDVRIVRDKDDSAVLAAEEVGIDFESGVREARSAKEVMRGRRAGEMVGEGEREQVERRRRRRQMKERGKKRKGEQAVDDRNKQLAAGVNRVGARKVLSQDEVKKAIGAANVKKGTVTGAAVGKSGGLNKSGKFFSQLQANVAAVEADARREGMLK